MERMRLFWLAAALPLALALQVRPMQKHMPHGCARCSSTRAPTPMLKQSAAQKEKKKKEKEDDGPYRKSVSLPITEFSQRAMSATREPELQRFWEEEQVYTKLAKENPGAPFVLHDGPPYANGDLHIGHALNKILKDIINRYQLLRGRKVRYVPGWDCHGLPIELKVLQSMNEAERKALTPIELRKKAAAFATQTVSTQRSSFKRYGVWGDWEAPYLTLQPEYEAAQIGVFGDMFLKGHIYRGRKPVHWSPSSRTALAEAELEYPEKHTSRSIYVGFTVTQPAPALQALASDGGPELRVAIWTTTPWTIPANLAVAVNGELEYAVVGHPSLPYRLIVATGLMEALAKRLDELPEGSALEKLGAFKGTEIEGTKYAHPFYARESQIVIGGDYITTESGTGLVHTAPGHGQDDYLTGLKYGLELLSPVDDAGCFTSEAGEDLKGMPVLAEGNTAVIAKLKAVGALLKEEAYVHKYPYDWRTKQPTIFRATSQWFASVDAFRVDALSAIDKVEWMPAVGQNRITAMTQSRSDWCISRQRTWGVPIPVFYHRDTNEVLLNRQIL
jgi:isoleucyl-tRNA synthetase